MGNDRNDNMHITNCCCSFFFGFNSHRSMQKQSLYYGTGSHIVLLLVCVFFSRLFGFQPTFHLERNLIVFNFRTYLINPKWNGSTHSGRTSIVQIEGKQLKKSEKRKKHKRKRDQINDLAEPKKKHQQRVQYSLVCRHNLKIVCFGQNRVSICEQEPDAHICREHIFVV